MKITKEKINKLPQLDRIEFRQRDGYLEISKMIAGFMFIVLLISMLFAPVRAFYIFLFPILIIGTYLFYLNPKYKKELINEYFESQVKEVKGGITKNEFRNSNL